jgi:hypothetical protein
MTGEPAVPFLDLRRLHDDCLALPVYPGRQERQVERVVEAVFAWFADG